MSEEPPKLVQLNLLVEDMAASLDFYRRLGVATADEESGPHAELSLPGGVTLELDTVESAGLWHAGVRADPASGAGRHRVLPAVAGGGRRGLRGADRRGIPGAAAALRRVLGRPLRDRGRPRRQRRRADEPDRRVDAQLATGRVARMTRVQRFTARVDLGPRGRGIIVVPFDPDEAWGAKSEHPWAARSTARRSAGRSRRAIAAGSSRCLDVDVRRRRLDRDGRDRRVAPGRPAARRSRRGHRHRAGGQSRRRTFWDTLAQFYRKAYLRWINATTRRPDLRAVRIAEVVDLLAAGVKERPRPRD